MINVLVVEDSAVVQEFLVHVLSGDPGLQVVGTARNGEEAVAAVARLRPDVITMDLNMPRMDGFEATRRIMESAPTPIVIVSGRADVRERATTFRSMEAGALAVLARPPGLGHPDYPAGAAELIRTVKLMSEVKVVRRRAAVSRPPQPPPPSAGRPAATIRLIGIGASTGGPPVVRDILAALPAGFPTPVVVVQHIAPGFTASLVEWLGMACVCPVVSPAHGERLRAGYLYVAPEGAHLAVTPDGHAALEHGPPEHGMRPAVSVLFRSLAGGRGPAAIGVLLTGMGKDGAAELKAMRDRGAVTIAQDFESSVVHGMPGEAISLGGATYVRAADQIADLLIRLAGGTI